MTFSRNWSNGVLVLGLLVSACGGGNSPTAPATQTPVTPSLVSLSGTVKAFDGKTISNATVTILDGPNINKTATTTAGAYTFSNLTPGGANLSAAKTDLGFTTKLAGVNINGTNTLDFVLDAPIFSQSGSGDTVFNMPVYVAKIHIHGDFPGFCSNFVLKVNGHLLVNEILGACSSSIGHSYDGTQLVPSPVTTLPGQVVETQISSGVSWSVTEVR